MQGRAMSAISIVLLALCPVVQSFAAEPVAPQAALTSYQNYLKSIQSVSFRASREDRSADQEEPADPQSEDWKIDLAGRRLWTGESSKGEVIGEAGERFDLSVFKERLATPEQLVSVMSEWTDPKEKETFVTSYLAVPKDYWARLSAFGDLAPAIGYCDLGIECGCRPIPAMLGSLAVKEQNAASVVLVSKTDESEFTLRLAPAKGWMPESIAYRRVAPVTDGFQYARVTYTVKQSGRFGDVWFPERYEVEATIAGGKHRSDTVIVSENGVETLRDAPEGSIDEIESSTAVTEIALAGIKLNRLTADDFRLQTTIPEGTPVRTKDAHDGRYVWLEGRIVPR